MRAFTGQTKSWRQPAASVTRLRAASIRASSGRRSAMNASVGPASRRAMFTFSICHARGAIVSGCVTRSPERRLATSIAVAGASRSKAAKKLPSGPKAIGRRSSARVCVPAGTVPLIQPP